MTAMRRMVLDKIWKAQDPLADNPALRGRVDFQGWASTNPLLSRAIEEIKPSLVVEVGVWKGGSVITMAEKMRDLSIDGAIIAIDTWLGAWDHWLQPQWFEHLGIEVGYPTLYRTFAANIIEKKLQDYVVPMPLDSLNAIVVLKHNAIYPDVLHIDGGHDYDAVMSDLRAWWPMLKPGGVLIGDDYHASGDVWPDVRRAFHDFFNTQFIENTGGKCWIKKDL